VEQLVERDLTAGTEVLGENPPQSILSTTNNTGPDLGLIPDRCCEKPTANCLTYGMDVLELNTGNLITFQHEKSECS
jgi:hypothetical protein